MTQTKQNTMQRFQEQLRCVAKFCMESHIQFSKKVLSELTHAQIYSSPNLSMVIKVNGKAHLTNPFFNIQGCLEQLYFNLIKTRALTSFLPEYHTVSGFCPAPRLKKKTYCSFIFII